jgi:hypothetical protein
LWFFICCGVSLWVEGVTYGAANIQPHLTLAVNQQSDATVYRGWPVLFTLEILRSDSLESFTGPDPFQLTPGPQGWSNTINLKMTSGGIEVSGWPTKLAGALSEPITMSSGEGAEFGWWISPEDSTSLPLGEYEVLAELNTTNAASGWKGKTNSSTAFVRVENEPATLTPEVLAEKLVQLAYYSFWNGKTNEATGFIEQLLTQQPTNITALSMQGDLAELGGNDEKALESRTLALQQYFLQHPDSEELPIKLIQKRRSSMEKVNSTESLILIARREGGELVLEWGALPGVIYRLESSPDLKNWSPFKEGLTTTGNLLQTRVNLSERAQFLRVAR